MFEITILTIELAYKEYRYKRVFNKIAVEKHRIWWYVWSGENDAYPWEKVHDPGRIQDLEQAYREGMRKYVSNLE